jgi:hypothetical protein
MSITIIVNPYANRYKCGSQIDIIDKYMKESGLDYHILLTKRKGMQPISL